MTADLAMELPMHYHVVYNRTDIGWWWFTLPVLLMFAVLVLFLVAVLVFARNSLGQRLLLLVVISVVVVDGVLTFSIDYYQRNFYRYYGPYQTTEGVVENYKVFPMSTGVAEQFDVHGVHFSYVDRFQWRCFHRAAANGGPIREGLPVRVSHAVLHIAPCIVKLEVADQEH